MKASIRILSGRVCLRALVRARLLPHFPVIIPDNVPGEEDDPDQDQLAVKVQEVQEEDVKEVDTRKLTDAGGNVTMTIDVVMGQDKMIPGVLKGMIGMIEVRGMKDLTGVTTDLKEHKPRRKRQPAAIDLANTKMIDMTTRNQTSKPSKL